MDPATQNNPAPPAGNNPPAGNQPPAANASWFPEQHKDYVTNKGWKAPADVLESYVSLEKFVGADKAGRAVILPKDANDAEGIKAYRAKIGVPESADKYELEVPAEQSDEFSKVASKWFHDLGVPKEQAQGLVKQWNSYMAEQMQAMDSQLQQQSEQELNTLKTEWGGEFETKAAVARDFLRQSGWTDADVTEYEKARGTGRMLKDFYAWGSKVQESGFAGGPGGGAPNMGGVTKEVAKQKYDQLQADRISGKISDKEWNGGKKAEYEGYFQVINQK